MRICAYLSALLKIIETQNQSLPKNYFTLDLNIKS